ncbi:hypothetical protein [Corynebacterium hadale]|uniref:hypothetical protein n=1 Tax=Corynebacterium hadale TaxID=2026255 RepID=UPI001F0B5A16|nr:hypothetical protein [Corynebacterium hadale]
MRRQSADTGAGVTSSLEAREGDESVYASLGAGDQGTVYGYATNKTSQRLPLTLVLAHEICRRLDAARTDGTIRGIGPDGKSQVSVVYDELDTPRHRHRDCLDPARCAQRHRRS